MDHNQSNFNLLKVDSQTSSSHKSDRSSLNEWRCLSPVPGVVKCVRNDLLEDLFRGKKNSVQCIQEYCSITKKKIDFIETGIQYRYGNYATIDGVEFPQGTGLNKKDAKIAAARCVFASLLDIDEEQFDAKFGGVSNIKLDRHGHKLIEPGSQLPHQLYSSDKIDELTRRLNELAVSKGVAATVHRSFVGDRPTSVASTVSSNLSDSFLNRTSSASTTSNCRPTLSTPSTSVIQNPITSLQAYCKENMIFVDIKVSECESKELGDSASIDYQSQPKFDEICNTLADFVKHLRTADETPIFQRIENRYYAAFIIKKTPNDVGKVVAFGIGSRCADPDSVTEDGQSLLDCHALPLARRALLQYFYGELNNYASGSSTRTIFEESDKDMNKLQLKSHVSLHLLVSGAPNGDAREFLPDDVDDPMTPYDLVAMRTAAHTPSFESPDYGYLRYKGISAICKAVLLSEFKSLSHKMKHIIPPDTTYFALKQVNVTYVERKKAMADYLERRRFGYWSFQKRHLEDFKWSSVIRPIVRNITG
ncbi:unnamed protein product [Didymodactylos carnosus]|uniref:Uncharacterized protein n=1 Tax=Didymodactylos carnosus TaxID=1234261 RepID=A0A8S2EAE8_9BILA|nr:unnamed protein product [Didymodactylos carnosus]CAF3985375.1 unnamed protein product [Didymodactylos carnosus]